MNVRGTAIFVRKRDFLAAGLSRWKFESMVEAGAIVPLPQELAGASRRHRLFPASELGRAIAGLPVTGACHGSNVDR